MIFGGTTEGRELSRRLAEAGADVTVSVASDYGSEEQGEQPGVTVLSGRMPVEEMTARLREMDLCVDATHPYAVRVTDSIARACAESATPRLRLLRAGSEYPAGTLLMKSAAEALDVPMLVLRRPEEEGEGFETVLAACLERMKEET